MAETVTITTFLELKDNMSAGLGKVEAALKKIGGAQTAQTQVERAQTKAAKEKTKETEKAAKAAEKAAKEKIKAIKEEERAKKQQARAERAAAKEREREQRQIERARLGPKVNPAARALEQLKVNQALERARLGPGHDPARRAIEQDRIARRMAKAREREQRQIAQAMLGPKYDPAARAQEQMRAQAEANRRNAAFQKENERFTRAQERAVSQVARATAIAQERARAKAARDEASAKKAFQRWGAQEAKAAERLERQKATAAIREQRRVEAERNRAARVEQRRQRDLSRQQLQAKADRHDFVGKAGAAMFGKGVGGFMSAAITSPMAALQLGVIGIVDGIVTGIRRALSTAYDLTKEFISKVFEVGKQYQENVRRVAMSLVGMDVAPTYEIAKQQASGFYDTLQTLAAKLPGETQDYVSVFSQGLPMALEQGEKSVQKFAVMASKFTAVAFTRGVKDVQHMGRDIERIMQGNALSTTRMYRELRPYIGMLAKDFNKLSSSERMARLYAGIEKAASGLSGTLHDADAVIGTLQSHIERIFRLGGQPLFQSALAIIERINKFLEDNNAKIVRMISLISSRLGNVLDGAVIKILDIAKNFDTITEKAMGVGTQIAQWATDVSPFFWMLSRIANTIADLVAEMERIGLQAELQRKQERTQQRYVEMSKAYGDPRVQQWMKSMPKTGMGLLGGETGVTRENEASIKAWAQAGLKMNIPREMWATVLQSAEGIQAHPDKVAEWFASTMQRPDLEAAPKRSKGAPKERSSTINDFRFSKFDIRQEFAEGFDPDRIAVAFASDLGKLGEMRMQSAYAPLYSVMGG